MQFIAPISDTALRSSRVTTIQCCLYDLCRDPNEYDTAAMSTEELGALRTELYAEVSAKTQFRRRNNK